MPIQRSVNPQRAAVRQSLAAGRAAAPHGSARRRKHPVTAPLLAVLILSGSLAVAVAAWESSTPPEAKSAGPPAGAPAPAVAAVAAAPAGGALANMDFAQGDLGQEPPGWFVPAAVKRNGYTAVLVADHPADGLRGAVIQAPPGGGQGHAFGTLMRSFDAAPYRGQRVRFRAAVKVGKAEEAAGAAEPGPVPPRAQLWLRVDRPGGKSGFFDNMDDRPITANDWGRFEIVGAVAADAEKINLGLILVGGGRAYLSAASFAAIGKAVNADEAARPLDDSGLGNLVAFTRLAGLVRYFHPSDQAAAADWNRFVLAGVQRVEKAAGPPELARTLTSLFLPLAPTVRVFRPAGPSRSRPSRLPHRQG